MGYFDLSLLVDENVIRTNISNFAFDFIEIFSTGYQTVKKVPKLLLLKVLTHFDTIVNFLFKKVRIVLITDLYR